MLAITRSCIGHKHAYMSNGEGYSAQLFVLIIIPIPKSFESGLTL